MIDKTYVTKTLGQVLYEGTIYTRMPWSMLHSPARDDYERMAQAVAAVVRERDASLADGYPECWQAIQIAANIRKQSA